MPLEIQMVTLALANAWVREEGNIQRMPSRYYEWDSIERLSERMPPLSNTVAVPHGDALSHWWGDEFYIASRAAARRVFVGFADSLETPVDRKVLSPVLQKAVWL